MNTKHRLGALVSCTLLLALGTLHAQELRFDGDFESDDLSGWRQDSCSTSQTAVNCNHSIQVVDSPLRSGRKAVRFELRRNDPDANNSKRSELLPLAEGSNGVLLFDINQGRHWMGFSTFLPEDWVSDPRSREIIAQWHEQPDSPIGSCDNWRSPPLAIVVQGEELIANIRWDPRRCSIGSPDMRSIDLPLGTIRRGEWMDWVFEIVFSYDDRGLTRIWRNDELVLDRQGPNSYNDEKGLYYKTGIYKWDWKSNPGRSIVDSRAMYLDEVKIAGNNGSYETVAPSSSDGSPTYTVTASSDDGNRPENTLDGRLDTRWSALGEGEWIQYDLGSQLPVSRIDVAFHRGDQRVSFADVQLSSDGSQWQTLRQIESSGTSNELERYEFQPTFGRYLRLVGYGNTENRWNSLTQVDIGIGEGAGVSQVRASSDDGNLPINTLDGDELTRWSAQGIGEWIDYDLGQALTVEAVDIAFHRGNERTAMFEIEASLDGDHWTSLYSGASSGSSIALERFDLPLTQARYLRIVGGGNSVNDWNSLTRVEVRTIVPFVDTSGHMITAASASADDGDGSVASNAIDGSLASRWSANGEGQWLSLDLGQIVPVAAVDLALFRGDERVTRFAIELSDDGQTWTRVRTGSSSGNHTQLERFLLPEIHAARFVRLVGYGNTLNGWTSLTEVQIPVIDPTSR